MFYHLESLLPITPSEEHLRSWVVQMKSIDPCLGLTAFSACLGLDSPQSRGEWSWPSCTLIPRQEEPLLITPRGILVLAASWRHCSGQCYLPLSAYPKASWLGPWTWMSPDVPFCCSTPPCECWRDHLLAAGDLGVSWARSSCFHINVWLAFSGCLSVMRLVPGEHSTARWTLISECSEREGSFSSFEDSAPL